jgi:hypothetical protein
MLLQPLPKQLVLSANCQHFANDILDALGINTQSLHDSPIGEFLAKIRAAYFPEELANTAADKDKVVFKFKNKTFRNHEELDVAAYELEVC